jgi:hypothetical protein
MSEAEYAESTAEERPEDAEAEAPEAEGGAPEEGGDEEEASAPKPDWEKQAHDKAGQAAKERSRRKAAERRANELESRLEKLETSKNGSTADTDELLEIIGSLRDDEEDPVGDIAAVKKALKAFRARQMVELEEASRSTAVTRQLEKLQVGMREAEEDFALDHPDYHAAASFYRKARVEELEEAGYAGRNLDRKLADDLYGVVRMAMESGQDPAERVYALAKRRGFTPGSKSPAEKKLETVQRAQESGLRPQGRPASGGQLSWEDVAKLDGAARDKAWAKLRERERGRRAG